MGIQVFTDRTLRERDKHVNEELQEKIKTLEADATEQEKTLAFKNKRITDLAILHERDIAQYIEIINMLKAENARLEETWKTNYDDLQARHDRLHATLGEMEQAQGELGLLFDKTATFLRRVAKGENIRSQQTGGRALIEQAKALLVQYDESGDNQVIGK